MHIEKNLAEGAPALSKGLSSRRRSRVVKVCLMAARQADLAMIKQDRLSEQDILSDEDIQSKKGI